jgi:hypothetical protein
MLTLPEYIFVALAAMVAGAINALAGGGTLVTFPTLIAVGLSPVVSNVTNTVALLPGYFGGALAQKEDLKGQRRRLWVLLPAAIAGGLLGGVLLLQTGEELFGELVPFLILGASLLLAVQDPVRAWLLKRRAQTSGAVGDEKSHLLWVILPVGLAAVYGGYFGAGLSVIVLAVLGLVLNDNLTRLNAAKQVIGLVTNMAAAVFFIFQAPVNWPVALVMMGGALLGGAIGGKLAGRVKPATLRWMVVTIGLVVGLIYLFR